MKTKVFFQASSREFAKHLRTYRFALAAVAMAIGCQGLINENPVVPQPVKLDDNFPTCYGELEPALKNFSEGTSSATEIGKGWDCVRLTLDSFTRQTQGKNRDFYEREELRTFLNRFVLKERPLSEPLFNELMMLKKSLLGGSEYAITTSELNKLRELTRSLEKEMIALNPFINILFLRENKVSDLDPAITTLKEVGTRIGDLLKSYQFSYGFDDFTRLIDALNFEDSGSRQKVHKWFQVASQVRALLTESQANSIAIEEWHPLITVAVQSYGIYLEWHYQIKESSWYNQPGFSRLANWAEKIMETLGVVLKDQTDQTITIGEVTDLLSELQGLVDFSIPIDLLKKYLPLFYSRFVAPTVADFLPGLNPPALTKIAWIFQRWAQTQKGILTGQRTNEYEELLALSHQMRPLLMSSSYRVLLRYDAGAHSTESLTALNWLSLATTLFFEAYATGPNNTLRSPPLPLENPGIPTSENWVQALGLPEGLARPPEESDLNRFFSEFEDLLIYLKIIYPKSIKIQPLRTTVESRYLNFQSTPSEGETRSNNQNIIRYREFLEYFSYTVSGIVGARRSFEILAAQCGMTKKDEFERPYLNILCSKALLQERPTLFLDNLPELQALFDSPHRPDWDTLFSLWYKAGQTQPNSEFGYEKWEQMLFLLNYVETLLLRFDTDRSGAITKNEAALAFPVYKSLLKLYSPGINDTLLELGFYFLVAKGRPPLNALEFATWQFSSHSRNFRSDRLMIFQIFGSLLGRLGI